MNPYINSIAAVVLLLSFTAKATAQVDGCPLPMETAAEDSAGNLTSWKDVTQFRARYHACDDGAVAEGLSDSVVKIMSRNWESLPVLISISKKDRAIVPFVVQHIDSTTSGTEITDIIRRSQHECPAGGARLCRQIHDAATQALRDLQRQH